MRNDDGILPERMGDGDAVHDFHVKMYLMQVKVVVFQRMILDDPTLHGSGMHDEDRRFIR